MGAAESAEEPESIVRFLDDGGQEEQYQHEEVQGVIAEDPSLSFTGEKPGMVSSAVLLF